ncbi:MAG: 50S ribosomal protein L6 [Candidatus Campbellbacteria bacterium]|nr:50S ribosomal protein L6 [Candidatus Campbellbacteria bacterium]
MSRVGKQELKIPNGTTVELNGDTVVVKGPKGTLERTLNPKVNVSVEDGEVKVTPVDDELPTQALWGTFASHIKNMIDGVNDPFEKKLEVEGVGYRAEMQGSDLVLNVGYSHPIKMPIPEGVEVSVEKNVISVSGPNKETVGQFASSIRSMRKPEPYKGKGIHYEDEYVRRKQGKKSV